MAHPNDDMLDQVEQYRQLVLQYEALDAEIDALIMASGGLMENLSPEELARYRDLAQQRDELLNEMRVLEQQLLPDDE